MQADRHEKPQVGTDSYDELQVGTNFLYPTVYEYIRVYCPGVNRVRQARIESARRMNEASVIAHTAQSEKLQ